MTERTMLHGSLFVMPGRGSDHKVCWWLVMFPLKSSCHTHHLWPDYLLGDLSQSVDPCDFPLFLRVGDSKRKFGRVKNYGKFTDLFCVNPPTSSLIWDVKFQQIIVRQVTWKTARQNSWEFTSRNKTFPKICFPLFYLFWLPLYDLVRFVPTLCWKDKASMVPMIHLRFHNTQGRLEGEPPSYGSA